MRALGRDHSHRGEELRLSRLQGPRRTRLRDQRAEVAPGRSSSTVRQAFGVGWSWSPVPSELGYAELRVHGVLGSSGYSRPPVPSPDGPPTRGSEHGAQPSQRRYPSALVLLRRAPDNPSRSGPLRAPRPRPRSPEPPPHPEVS